MPHHRRFAALLAALALTATLPAQAPSPQLKTVLDQLDAAAAKFKNTEAHVVFDNYTHVVRDHTLQSGSTYVERAGTAQQMGAIFFDLDAGGKPGKTPAKVLQYTGGVLHMYTPGTGQDDIFQAGANQAKYESFLTLGFGGSGRDLARSWTIQDEGPETLSDSGKAIRVEKLDLVSKDPGVAGTFKHVTIWVDPVRGLSLKQIFYAPNGDNRIAIYSDIRLNTRIDKKPYAISKGATPIRH